LGKRAVMRGVESTVMIRVYPSDNDRLTLWIAAKNSGIQGKRWTRADAIRGMIAENLRMKKRIKYLQFDNGTLHKEIKKLKECVYSL
jgi:hypothetical protein